MRKSQLPFQTLASRGNYDHYLPPFPLLFIYTANYNIWYDLLLRTSVFFFFLISGYGVFIVLFPVKSIQHHGFTQCQWGHYLSASVFVYEHFDFAYMAEFFKKPRHRFCFLLVFLAMQLYGLSSFCLCRSFKI